MRVVCLKQRHQTVQVMLLRFFIKNISMKLKSHNFIDQHHHHRLKFWLKWNWNSFVYEYGKKCGRQERWKIKKKFIHFLKYFSVVLCEISTSFFIFKNRQKSIENVKNLQTFDIEIRKFIIDSRLWDCQFCWHFREIKASR